MPVWCPIGSNLCQHAGGPSVTTEACTSPHLPGFVWCGGLKAHWGYLRYDGSWQYCEKGPCVMISLYMKDDHYKSSIDENMQDIRPNYVLEYKVFRGNFRKKFICFCPFQFLAVYRLWYSRHLSKRRNELIPYHSLWANIFPYRRFPVWGWWQ